MTGQPSPARLAHFSPIVSFRSAHWRRPRIPARHLLTNSELSVSPPAAPCGNRDCGPTPTARLTSWPIPLKPTIRSSSETRPVSESGPATFAALAIGASSAASEFTPRFLTPSSSEVERRCCWLRAAPWSATGLPGGCGEERPPTIQNCTWRWSAITRCAFPESDCTGTATNFTRSSGMACPSRHHSKPSDTWPVSRRLFSSSPSVTRWYARTASVHQNWWHSPTHGSTSAGAKRNSRPDW